MLGKIALRLILLLSGMALSVGLARESARPPWEAEVPTPAPPITTPRTSQGLGSLFAAIRQVESGGDDYAIGDGGRSRGPYQIGLAYWQDACAQGGCQWDYLRLVWSRPHCEQVMRWYWKRYGAETDEERARCHNSGPRWRQKYGLTDKYWRRVKAAMQGRAEALARTFGTNIELWLNLEKAWREADVSTLTLRGREKACQQNH